MSEVISVIIPCYQAEKYIGRCVESLINQTIGINSLELIFVDDHSSDSTVDILKSYEKKYPENIIIVECEENGRQGRARNIGLTYASGQYIGFVDADDWIEPVMYEHMYNKIKNYDCDVVFCRNRRDTEYRFEDNIRNGKNSDKMIEIESDIERKKLIASNIIGVGVWDKLYKRGVIFDNDLRFPEGVAYEDIYFGAMVYFCINRIYILEEYLYHYFVNWNSTVLTNEQKYSSDLEKVNELKYSQYVKCGFWEKYKEELEFDLICTYYLAAVKMFCLRFETFPYNAFVNLKNRINELLPDATSNTYINTNLSQLNKILVETLDRHISENEMQEIAKIYRKMAK